MPRTAPTSTFSFLPIYFILFVIAEITLLYAKLIALKMALAIVLTIDSIIPRITPINLPAAMIMPLTPLKISLMMANVFVVT